MKKTTFKNVTIYFDSCYAAEAVNFLMKFKFFYKIKFNKFAIFIIEARWITNNQLELINNIDSNNVLIIGMNALRPFLSSMIKFSGYHFISLDMNFYRFFHEMDEYISNCNNLSSFHSRKLKLTPCWTKNELTITYLFVNGFSINDISKIIGLDQNKIYNIKKKALRKVGITSTVELIFYWNIIRAKFGNSI